MTDQKTPDGTQERPEGGSATPAPPEGQNGRETGTQSLQGEQQPRGPVDWAWQQAAERETQTADPNVTIRAAKFTAAHWHQAALDLADIPMAHAIACIRAALAGETRPDQLGLDEDAHDAFRAALQRPAHNAGPSIRQCADQDAAHWNDKYAGEGQ